MKNTSILVQRIAGTWAVLGSFIFIVSGLVYLWLGRWTVTHQDYWRIYDFCLNHTWLRSALHYHNAHCLFFPSFFWLVDLHFLHGRQLPLFLAGLALQILSVVFLLIPVWRENTVDVTARLIASYVIIAGGFWLVRGPILASGGFNIICSLVLVATTVGVLSLHAQEPSSARPFIRVLIAVLAGFVATFSFSTGLAIWPTLFVVAWSLGRSWRALLGIGIAGIAAITLYLVLSQEPKHYGLLSQIVSGRQNEVTALCRLAGGPFYRAAAAWNSIPITRESAAVAGVSLWFGVLGLATAMSMMAFSIVRRDLAKSSIELIGMTLIVFNFVAMLLIIAGNIFRGPRFEFEYLSPRYLFWTTPFWIGILLVTIQHTASKRWLHWPVYLLALLLPSLTLPAHYKAAEQLRFARAAAEGAAIGLVTGVRDDEQVKRILFSNPKQVYRVAEQLRLRRLDFFADGLQDWIGQAESKLFENRHRRENLRGQCAVVSLLQNNGVPPAAQVRGWTRRSEHGPSLIRWMLTVPSLICGREIKNIYPVARTLVIIDQTGAIRGLARSFVTPPVINCFFYLGQRQPDAFVGYIPDYDHRVRYMIRSADNGILSEESIPVQDLISAAKIP